MFLGMLNLVLVTSTCQVVSGVLLWILAALDLHINEKYGCRELNAGIIIIGLFQFLGGLAGLTLAMTRKKGSPTSSIQDDSRSKVSGLLPIIYVGLSAAVIVPMIVHRQSVQCVPFDSYYDDSALPIAIFKLIITYMGFLFSICAVTLTLTEYTKFKICKKQNPTEEKIQSSNNVTASTPKKNNKQPTIQLPEAKTHQQEAPGSGEKVTVITLPEADGVVYAVPEECYVVKKGESTYVTPPGDHRWTKFFPSYKKVDAD